MEQTALVELLQKMTVSEKISQLVQLTSDFFSVEGEGEITGPMQEWNLPAEKLFQIGSVLGTHTAEQVKKLQTTYLEKSRLKIPLLFMADVIHGYETIYPIPLALAASFDEVLIEEVARLSAKEATAAGIQVTFSPMADHVKDARWGRVMESNGEDPTLSAVLTKAYVKGYQGNDLANDKQRLAACVKHFIGYGAAEGGRDYHTVDFSDIEMYQNYLPSFKAAIKAGAELVMTAFNTVHGIPASGNQQLLQDVLRKELDFDGVVISDWAAVAELMAHRVAADKAEAARFAFEAGVEMDMMSDCYLLNLEDSIQTPTQHQQLDEAVLRILTLKNKLGLFEDPYRGLMDSTMETKETTNQFRDLARKSVHQTTVLLKNEQLLPIKQQQKVALIGPKATSQDILGAWSWMGKTEQAISLAEGLAAKNLNLSTLSMPDGAVVSEEMIQEAIALAKQNEIVVLALGETSEESGEAASLAYLELSRNQERLIHEVAKVNTNIILVLFNGRPLVLKNVVNQAKAIVEAWFPGSEGGHGLADILMGEVDPQGRLPMSFPAAVGQVPITYAQLSTGRPMNEQNKNQKYISRYMDETNEALFPFGHGLSYSQFELKQVSNTDVFNGEGTVEITCKLKNNSAQAGNTIVQLYLQDCVAQVARPMKELKKWQALSLEAYEEKTVRFQLTMDDFAYIGPKLVSQVDEGEFKVYIGLDSHDCPIEQTIFYQKLVRSVPT